MSKYNFNTTYDPNRKSDPRNKRGYKRKVFLKLALHIHEEAKKEGKKQSWNESQRLVSKILPEFQDAYVSKIDYKKVDRLAKRAEKYAAPIKEVAQECGSVFKVPISDITEIEWYDIGNYLPRVPGDVKVQVDGGIYGSTDIKFRSDVDYHKDEINQIVNAIRADVENDSDKFFIWQGYPTVIPGKKDNGKNCNYYIKFLLEIDGTLIKLVTEAYPKQYEELSDKEKEERVLRIRETEAERKARMAKRKVEQQREKAKKEKLTQAKGRQRGTEKPKEGPAVTQDYAKILDMLYRDYKEDLMTAKEYKDARNKILRKMDRDE